MGLLENVKSLMSGISVDVYIGDLPGSPNDLVVLYLSGGESPELTLDGNCINQPSFQVRIRASSYETALSIIAEAKEKLTGIANQTINGTYYLSITQKGDVLPLGRDTNGRWEFTINYQTKTR